MDTETAGIAPYDTVEGSALCPHMGRISLLQIRAGAQTVIFDILLLERQGWDWEEMSEALASREALIFANAQFDLKFLKRHTGRLYWNARCVVTLARLLSNATGSKLGKSRGHRLNDLVRDYFDVHLSGKGEADQTSVWSVRPLPEEKIRYAVRDVLFLEPLYDLLMEALTSPLPEPDSPGPFGWGMAGLVEIEMQMTTVAAEIEFNGLPASAEIFQQVRQLTDERLADVTKELCDALGLDWLPHPYEEHSVLIPKHTQSTLNNPVSLVTLLQSKGLEAIDTAQANTLTRTLQLMDEITYDDEGTQVSGPRFVGDEADRFGLLEVMEEGTLQENKRLVSLVLEYKRLVKQQGMDLSRFINPATGRIHPSFNTLGAATGRSSSARPNLQNVTARTVLVGRRDIQNLWPSSAQPSLIRHTLPFT